MLAVLSLAQNQPVARERSVYFHGYECEIAGADADEWNITPRGRNTPAPEEQEFRLKRGYHPASPALPGFRNMYRELIGEFGWSSAAIAVQRFDKNGWDLVWTANSLDKPGLVFEANTDAVTQVHGDTFSIDFHGARMLACRPSPHAHDEL